MRPIFADQTQAADVSKECVVWVDIIRLYLLPTRNMHEMQFLNKRYNFRFKPLKNTREELFTFNFIQFATPDSRGIQLFLLVVLIHFNLKK